MEEQNVQTTKLTDKAFSRFIGTAMLGILVCIACLSSATWAWFNAADGSQPSTIRGGSFDQEISIEILGSGGVVTLSPLGETKQSCELERGKSYTITLSPSEQTTVKGYCVITVDGEKYNTGSFGIDTEDIDETLVFTLTLPDGVGVTEVIFESHWGIAVNKHVENGAVFTPGT